MQDALLNIPVATREQFRLTGSRVGLTCDLSSQATTSNNLVQHSWNSQTSAFSIGINERQNSLAGQIDLTHHTGSNSWSKLATSDRRWPRLTRIWKTINQKLNGSYAHMAPIVCQNAGILMDTWCDLNLRGI